MSPRVAQSIAMDSLYHLALDKKLSKTKEINKSIVSIHNIYEQDHSITERCDKSKSKPKKR